MGRTPCYSEEEELNRGAWTAVEDQILRDYIKTHGEGKWRNIPKEAGLKRCGKSCRLRWLNYLRPGIKRGNISQEEEDLIIRLHKLLGNRWSLISGRLPGRTDNEIKNYWNTTLRKKVRSFEQSKQCKDYIKITNCNSSAKTTPLTKLNAEGSTDNVKAESQSIDRTLSITSPEINNNQLNYITQFNFGDISDSDFWEPICHFDYSTEAEIGSTGCATNRNRLPFNRPVPFSEELHKDWIADTSFSSYAN